MRVLVYLDTLDIGGAEVMAIDLVRALNTHGHQALLASAPGPLAKVAEDARVPLVLGDSHSSYASWGSARFVDDVAEQFGADLVHAVGGRKSLEAMTLAGFRRGRAVVADYRLDALPPIFPRTTALVAGQNQVVTAARARGMRAHAIPCPVDTERNHPGVDGTEFRARHAPPSGSLVVVVSRLAHQQKIAGLERTVAAARFLADRGDRLVIVGDGNERARFEDQAALVNHDAGAEVVRFVGPLVDPRPAYAAADVVVGLATSVLRGMAIGRPAVVLGREGASLVAEPANRPVLERNGWITPGASAPPEELARQLASLLDDPARSAELGRWARQVVVDSRSLAPHVDRLEREVYSEVLRQPPHRAAIAVDLARCWSRLAVARSMDAIRQVRAALSERRSTSPGGGGR